ncbi:MAG: DUF1232 domain-containing protein [Treponema sp.]|nr:DUF1232 domain-containing protein [Treponema sp.]
MARKDIKLRKIGKIKSKIKSKTEKSSPPQTSSEITTQESTPSLSETQRQKAIKWSQGLGKLYSEEKMQKLQKSLEEKWNRYFSKKALKENWDKIEYLWSKLKEKETPLKVKIAIFGGFAYLLLPADIIPDVIPGLGFIDDVTVFLYIWKTVVPYLKNITAEIAEEIASEKIQVALTESFRTTIIRSLIILFINMAATLIACFRPFGQTPSNYVAALLFASCLIYTIIRIISLIVKNGPMTCTIISLIIKEHSVRKGIASYVRSSNQKIFRQITKAFKIAQTANQMTDLDLPSLEDVIHHYVKKFLKTILLFFSLYWTYIILVYWLLKPYLLNHYANLTMFQILLYPITHIFITLGAIT